MQLARLYHTLRPLRWQQYWYRFWHPVKRKFFGGIETPPSVVRAAQSWPAQALFPLPVFDRYDPGKRAFDLLNIHQVFEGGIDWNFTGHGLLWCYHLNYFGWMEDESIPAEARLQTWRDYPSGDYPSLIPDLKAGLAPYPVSMRGMNLIRFCLRHAVQDYLLLEDLYAQYGWLYHFPEYHLQGNHLWQNGCSLLCAGLFFQSEPFYKRGKKILLNALREQVLPDGGHIEGSPMYHSLLLSSLLQCIELSTCLKPLLKDGDIEREMRLKAGQMLGWLEQITFSNSTWPQVNDSTEGVAPRFDALRQFADSLGIHPVTIPLGQCGYRMYRKGNYELFIDAGSIQPAWQPGHAHSDELSFCLSIKGQQVIVDTGMHTYQEAPVRLLERGTAAHNTFSVPGRNASDIWKAFRVGRRARVVLLQESRFGLTAQHNGYRFNYTRKFYISEDCITLEDWLPMLKVDGELMLHFHPDIILKKYSDSGILAGNLQIYLENHLDVNIEDYNFCEAFNMIRRAQRLRIKASHYTLTRLYIKC